MGTTICFVLIFAICSYVEGKETLSCQTAFECANQQRSIEWTVYANGYKSMANANITSRLSWIVSAGAFAGYAAQSLEGTLLRCEASNSCNSVNDLSTGVD